MRKITEGRKREQINSLRLLKPILAFSGSLSFFKQLLLFTVTVKDGIAVFLNLLLFLRALTFLFSHSISFHSVPN